MATGGVSRGDGYALPIHSQVPEIQGELSFRGSTLWFCCQRGRYLCMHGNCDVSKGEDWKYMCRCGRYLCMVFVLVVTIA